VPRLLEVRLNVFNYRSLRRPDCPRVDLDRRLRSGRPEPVALLGDSVTKPYLNTPWRGLAYAGSVDSFPSGS
jgi:hypothetical protein